MEVKIRLHSVDLMDTLRRYAERRLRLALGRSSDRIRQVTVSLAGLDGPRGGADKCCWIQAELLPSGRIGAEGADSDVLTAVDQAIERLESSFWRRRPSAGASEGGGESERHALGPVLVPALGGRENVEAFPQGSR